VRGTLATRGLSFGLLLLTSPLAVAGGAPERSCPSGFQQIRLVACQKLVGNRNPPSHQAGSLSPGYYSAADLAREFSSDCLARLGSDAFAYEGTRCDWQSLVDYLATCVEELRDTVGKKRAALLRVARPIENDTGTVKAPEYASRRCVVLRAAVTFEAVRPAVESDGDTVVEVLLHIGGVRASPREAAPPAHDQMPNPTSAPDGCAAGEKQAR